MLWSVIVVVGEWGLRIMELLGYIPLSQVQVGAATDGLWALVVIPIVGLCCCVVGSWFLILFLVFAVILILVLLLFLVVVFFFCALIGGGGLFLFLYFFLMKKEDFEGDEELQKRVFGESKRDTANFNFNLDLFQIRESEIKLTKVIGSGGSQSTIYLGKWKSQLVAVKVFRTMSVYDGSTHDFEEFERELNILGSISHPGIIQIYGCIIHPPRTSIVLEYCEKGDLQGYFYSQKTDGLDFMPTRQKCHIIVMVSSAIEYLHNRAIIHRDLKSENILLLKTLDPKLIDFGVSKVFEESEENHTKQVGTSFYMAPEVVRGTYDEKCDIFSLSIIIYELFTENFRPYDAVMEKRNMGVGTPVEYLVEQNPDFRPIVTHAFKKEYPKISSLIVRMWKHDPLERPKISEVEGMFTELVEGRFSEENEGVNDNKVVSFDHDPSHEESVEDDGKEKKISMKDLVTGKVKRPISKTNDPKSMFKRQNSMSSFGNRMSLHMGRLDLSCLDKKKEKKIEKKTTIEIAKKKEEPIIEVREEDKNPLPEEMKNKELVEKVEKVEKEDKNKTQRVISIDEKIDIPVTMPDFSHEENDVKEEDVDVKEQKNQNRLSMNMFSYGGNFFDHISSLNEKNEKKDLEKQEEKQQESSNTSSSSSSLSSNESTHSRRRNSDTVEIPDEQGFDFTPTIIDDEEDGPGPVIIVDEEF